MAWDSGDEREEYLIQFCPPELSTQWGSRYAVDSGADEVPGSVLVVNAGVRTRSSAGLPSTAAAISAVPSGSSRSGPGTGSRRKAGTPSRGTSPATATGAGSTSNGKRRSGGSSAARASKRGRRSETPPSEPDDELLQDGDVAGVASARVAGHTERAAPGAHGADRRPGGSTSSDGRTTADSDMWEDVRPVPMRASSLPQEVLDDVQPGAAHDALAQVQHATLAPSSARPRAAATEPDVRARQTTLSSDYQHLHALHSALSAPAPLTSPTSFGAPLSRTSSATTITPLGRTPVPIQTSESMTTSVWLASDLDQLFGHTPALPLSAPALAPPSTDSKAGNPTPASTTGAALLPPDPPTLPHAATAAPVIQEPAPRVEAAVSRHPSLQSPTLQAALAPRTAGASTPPPTLPLPRAVSATARAAQLLASPPRPGAAATGKRSVSAASRAGSPKSPASHARQAARNNTPAAAVPLVVVSRPGSGHSADLFAGPTPRGSPPRPAALLTGKVERPLAQPAALQWTRAIECGDNFSAARSAFGGAPHARRTVPVDLSHALSSQSTWAHLVQSGSGGGGGGGSNGSVATPTSTSRSCSPALSSGLPPNSASSSSVLNAMPPRVIRLSAVGGGGALAAARTASPDSLSSSQSAPPPSQVRAGVQLRRMGGVSVASMHTAQPLSSMVAPLKAVAVGKASSGNEGDSSHGMGGGSNVAARPGTRLRRTRGVHGGSGDDVEDTADGGTRASHAALVATPAAVSPALAPPALAAGVRIEVGGRPQITERQAATTRLSDLPAHVAAAAGISLDAVGERPQHGAEPGAAPHVSALQRGEGTAFVLRPSPASATKAAPPGGAAATRSPSRPAAADNILALHLEGAAMAKFVQRVHKDEVHEESILRHYAATVQQEHRASGGISTEPAVHAGSSVIRRIGTASTSLRTAAAAFASPKLRVARRLEDTFDPAVEPTALASACATAAPPDAGASAVTSAAAGATPAHDTAPPTLSVLNVASKFLSRKHEQFMVLQVSAVQACVPPHNQARAPLQWQLHAVSSNAAAVQAARAAAEVSITSPFRSSGALQWAPMSPDVMSQQLAGSGTATEQGLPVAPTPFRVPLYTRYRFSTGDTLPPQPCGVSGTSSIDDDVKCTHVAAAACAQPSATRQAHTLWRVAGKVVYAIGCAAVEGTLVHVLCRGAIVDTLLRPLEANIGAGTSRSLQLRVLDPLLLFKATNCVVAAQPCVSAGGGGVAGHPASSDAREAALTAPPLFCTTLLELVPPPSG